MVFSELLDNVFNLLNNKEEKHHKQEKKALNQLDQGMALLNSRKQIMDKVQHKLSLVESFDSSKLDATNRKEVEILKSMEGEFNEKLSAYSTSYKTFMENYYNAVNQVKNCKSKCLTNYPIGSILFVQDNSDIFREFLFVVSSAGLVVQKIIRAHWIAWALVKN